MASLGGNAYFPFLVSGFWFLVSGFWFLVRAECVRAEFSDGKLLVAGSVGVVKD
jgi:hypothetical protein